MQIEIDIKDKKRPFEPPQEEIVQVYRNLVEGLPPLVDRFNEELLQEYETGVALRGTKKNESFPRLTLSTHESDYSATLNLGIDLEWTTRRRQLPPATHECNALEYLRPISGGEDFRREEISYVLPELGDWELWLFWKAERFVQELRKYYRVLLKALGKLLNTREFPGLTYDRNRCLAECDCDETTNYDCWECTAREWESGITLHDETGGEVEMPW